MDNKLTALENAAKKAAENAYAPYSAYQVGAAIMSADGEIFVGANVENASYPCGICAERAALSAAVVSGKREFSAVAVYAKKPPYPCGICRQMLSEFGDMRIIVSSDSSREEHKLSELLPFGFKL